MTSRDEIIEMLTAAAARSGRPDITLVIEGFADQLVQIDNEHHKQIAQVKAMFDAGIDAAKREMAFVTSNLEGALKRFFLSLEGGLSKSSVVIDHAEFATKLAKAKEQFDREITALRQELAQANREPATPCAINGINGSGRSPDDVLN
jgi:hypothetical protein